MTPLAVPGLFVAPDSVGMARAAGAAQSLAGKLADLTGLAGVPGKIEESVAGIRDFANRQIDDLLNGAVSAAKSTSRFAETTLRRAGGEVDRTVDESISAARTALHTLSEVPDKAMDLLTRAERIKKRAQKRRDSLKSRAKSIQDERVKLAGTHWEEFSLEMEEDLISDTEELEQLGDSEVEEGQRVFDRTMQDTQHHRRVLSGHLESTHRRAAGIRNEVSGGVAASREWAANQVRRVGQFKSEQLTSGKSIGSLDSAGSWVAESVNRAQQLAQSIQGDAAQRPREVSSFGQRRVEEAMQLSQTLHQGVETAREWVAAQTHAQGAWRIAMDTHAERSDSILKSQAVKILNQIATHRAKAGEPIPPSLEEPVQEAVEESRAVDPDPLEEKPTIESKPLSPESRVGEPVFPSPPIEPDTPSVAHALARPLASPHKLSPSQVQEEENAPQQAALELIQPPSKPQEESVRARYAKAHLPISEATPIPRIRKATKGPLSLDTHISKPPSLQPKPTTIAGPKPIPPAVKSGPEPTQSNPKFNWPSVQGRKPKASEKPSSKSSEQAGAIPDSPQISLPQTPKTPPITQLSETKSPALGQSPIAPTAPKKAPAPSTDFAEPTESSTKPASVPQPPSDPKEIHNRLLAAEGPGATPDANVRSQLGPHVGFDPSMVRLHTGPVAQSAAQSLGADAFTIGRDVFFGAGKYNPTSPSGLGLIGHEVTHVGQQLGLRGDKLRFHTKTGGDAMEQEAQQVGERIASNISAGPRLKIAEYVRLYEPADDEPITSHLQTRLDSLSLRALMRAGQMLRPSKRHAPVRLDAVQVDLTLDMESMSDIEIVETWAEAIVSAVEAAQPRGLVSATTGERAIQRHPGDDPPKLPEPKALPEEGEPRKVPTAQAEALIKAKMEQVSASSADKKLIRQLHVRKKLDKLIKEAKEERTSFKYKALRIASGVTLIQSWEFDEDDLPYVNAMFREYEIASAGEYQLIEAQFIKMFWSKGIEATKHLLNENKKIAENELMRYWGSHGATNAMRRLKDVAGELSDSAFSFTTRYNTIVEQENKYNKYRKIRPQLPFAKSSQMPLLYTVLTEANLPSSYYEELRPRWDAWMKQRAARGREFPILLSDFDIGDIRGTSDNGKLATMMGRHVNQIIMDIEHVHKELDEDRFWKLPKMIDLTRDTLGFQRADGAGITLDEYIKEKKEDEALWEMIKAAAAIALAVVGMVATGGLAAVAMVGSAAMSVHSAVKASYDYAFNKAAVNTAVETAKRISKDEPSLLALAFEIIAAGLDVAGAIHAFNAIKSAAKAANALDPESMSKLKEAAESAYETALKEGGELKMTRDAFVNRIVDFGAKGLATAEHHSDKLRMMAELSKGTSNRVRLLMKNDPAAIEKLIDDFGELDELVDVLLHCGEDGKQILTHVGNHIHAEGAMAATTKAGKTAGAADTTTAKGSKSADNIASQSDNRLPAQSGDGRVPDTPYPHAAEYGPVPKINPNTGKGLWTMDQVEELAMKTPEGRQAVLRNREMGTKIEREMGGDVVFDQAGAPSMPKHGSSHYVHGDYYDRKLAVQHTDQHNIYIYDQKNAQEAVLTYIHETEHAWQSYKGNSMFARAREFASREEWLAHVFAEEAQAASLEIRAQMRLARSSEFTARTGATELYMKHFDAAKASYMRRMATKTTEEVDEMAHQFATRLYELDFMEGRVTSSAVGNPTYLEQYGKHWDIEHGVKKPVTAVPDDPADLVDTAKIKVGGGKPDKTPTPVPKSEFADEVTQVNVAGKSVPVYTDIPRAYKMDHIEKSGVLVNPARHTVHELPDGRRIWTRQGRLYEEAPISPKGNVTQSSSGSPYVGNMPGSGNHIGLAKTHDATTLTKFQEQITKHRETFYASMKRVVAKTPDDAGIAFTMRITEGQGSIKFTLMGHSAGEHVTISTYVISVDAGSLAIGTPRRIDETNKLAQMLLQQ